MDGQIDRHNRHLSSITWLCAVCEMIGWSVLGV